MRRRDFIGTIGGAAVWPLAARAQPGPVMGFLTDSIRTRPASWVALAQGLKETGFVEGQNLVIERRYTDGHPERMPALAAELGRPPTAVIWASGNIAAQAAKAATTTIPIVFSTGDDPVATGLVPSLSRPGSNMTGVSYVAGALPAKRLELLRELVPKLSVVGHLINPNNRSSAIDTATVRSAAEAMGLKVVVVTAAAMSELEPAFVKLAQSNVGALLINNDVFLFSTRIELVALAARYAIPAINPVRDYAEIGGLITYGSDSIDAVRQVGVYVGRILKGAKPADLPVLQPTKFELVVNLRTAKALGLSVPESFLVRADEVIE